MSVILCHARQARVENGDSKLISVGWDLEAKLSGMTPRNAKFRTRASGDTSPGKEKPWALNHCTSENGNVFVGEAGATH